MTYEQLKKEMLESFSVSNALKDAIRAFAERDMLDALKDAEELASLFKLQWEEFKTANQSPLLDAIAKKV